MKNKTTHLLFSLMCISLLVNIFLLYKLHIGFIKLQQVRGAPQKPIVSERFIGKPYETLFIIGDSRAQMWGVPRIKGALKHVKNYGVGGSTSNQILNQIKLFQNAITDQVVLIQLGINDIHWIKTEPLHRQKIILDNLKNNIKNIVKILIEKRNRVVLTTIIPPQKPSFARTMYWPKNGLDYIREVNGTIIQLNQTYTDVVVLDTHAQLVNKESNYLKSEYNDPDFFLHVNKKAYTFLTNSLSKVLFELQKR